MIYPIKIKSARDVVKVSNICAESGENVTITCQTMIFDPRSVLGLFNIVGKDATLVGPDHMNPDNFMKLVKKLGAAV